ncbi:MAG: hypothetical protein ACE37I_05480 [Rubinisphaera brasiliensis]|uniref:hypothetical protein n=1 Tax=Rubinisphaera brasiliensis TaxID=119 RepID=UPI00391DE310
MDAQEFVNLLRDDNSVLRLACFDDHGNCIGRGQGLVVDDDKQIAVMLTNCGNPQKTNIKPGAVVAFIEHPEAEPKIVGRPAYWDESTTEV